MKMKPEHFEYLREKVEHYLADNPTVLESYANGDFYNSDKCCDLQLRVCSDLSRLAVGSIWICDNLYPYLLDSHLFTAMKRIVPSVERKY